MKRILAVLALSLLVIGCATTGPQLSPYEKDLKAFENMRRSGFQIIETQVTPKFVTIGVPYESIGLQDTIIDGKDSVLKPIEGGPADRAGIKAGDKIIKVDGKSIIGLNHLEVAKLRRGPKGTQVTLTIQHEGNPSLIDYTLTRNVFDPRKEFHIAVLPENDFDPDDEDISNKMELALLGDGWSVIERSNLKRVLREQGLKLSGILEPNERLAIGKILGVSVLVFCMQHFDEVEVDYGGLLGTGKLSGKSGTIKFVDVETGSIILGFSFKWTDNQSQSGPSWIVFSMHKSVRDFLNRQK